MPTRGILQQHPGLSLFGGLIDERTRYGKNLKILVRFAHPSTVSSRLSPMGCSGEAF